MSTFAVVGYLVFAAVLAVVGFGGILVLISEMGAIYRKGQR